MNYIALKKTAVNLLKKFGNVNKSVLLHKEDGKIVEYKGYAVKLNYDSEAIGLNGNVIQAGDAKVLCMFDVMPVETVDVIKIEDERFSIVHSGDTSPDNVTKLLYTLQVRKG